MLIVMSRLLMQQVHMLLLLGVVSVGSFTCGNSWGVMLECAVTGALVTMELFKR